MAIELTSNLAFVLAIISLGVELIAVYLFPKIGWDELRRLPALDACYEAVHICAEKGKILFYEMGGIAPSASANMSPGAPAWVPATLSLIKSIAAECAQTGVEMQLVAYSSIGALMARDYMKEGYLQGGKPDMYSPELVTYNPSQMVGFLYSVDVIKKEKPGAGICIGAHWWGTQLTFVEQLNIEGAFSVCGTIYPADNAGSAVAADVATFGEENISIGSYLDNDPLSSSCLIGEDIIKLGLMACCIIVPILVTFFGVAI